MRSDSDNLNIVVGPDRSSKALAIAVPVVCAALGIFANITTDHDLRVGLLMLASLLLFISILAFCSLGTRYRATNAGLFLRGIRKEVFFPWHSVSLIGLRRSSITHKPLQLRITDGQSTLSLSSSGIDRSFDLLAQQVIHRAKSIPAATLPAQVHSRASRWLMLVVSLMFLSLAVALAVFAIRDDSMFGLFAAPMGLLPIAMIVWEARRSIHGIAADSTGVTLHVGFSTRHIPWDRLVIHRLVQSNPDEPISQMHIQYGSAQYVTDALLVNSAAFQPIAKLLIERGHLNRWDEISSNPEFFVRLSRWFLFPQLWILFVVFAGLAWLLSYFELPRETWLGVAFCCSALLTCVVYTFVHSINALHATPDGLHVTAPFRHAFIPWDQLHVTQCHRESPEGKIISIRFGSPPKLWSLNLFHNKSTNVQTLCNIILSRAATSTPLPAQ